MRRVRARSGLAGRLVARLHRLHRWLRRPVRVQRVGINLHFVVAPPEPPARPSPMRPAASLPTIDIELLVQMREDLARVLDRVPVARSVFPALALVERALGRRRTEAIDRLPLVVLRDAATQLNRLGVRRDGDALTALRERFRLVLGEGGETADELSFCTTVEVGEASLTQFMEADQDLTQHLEALRDKAEIRGVN